MTGDTAMENAIAIVGISGAYAGAETLDRFHEKLLCGEPRGTSETGTLSPCRFDVQDFGIPPIYRRVIPDLLLRSLGSVEAAIENSSLDMAAFPTEKVDVIFGSCFSSGSGSRNEAGLSAPLLMNELKPSQISGDTPSPEYEAWYEALDALFREDYPFSFNDKLYEQASSIPSQIALRHGFKGRSLALECAELTSMMALKTAGDHLKDRCCDMAVVTCAQLWENPVLREAVRTRGGKAFEGGSLSSDASRLPPCEGIGTVILMRLEDALERKAGIHALIRSVCLLHEPVLNATGEHDSSRTEAIRRALAAAGVSPASVHMLEVSGPCEDWGRLYDLFCEGGTNESMVRLGKVEEMTGQTYANMGLAGLTKTALMLRNRLIFPRPENFSLSRKTEGRSQPECHPFMAADKSIYRFEDMGGEPLRGVVLCSAEGGGRGCVVMEEYRSMAARGRRVTPKKWSQEPIAVVGAGACFPCASSLEHFWANIRNGTDTLTPVPDEVLPRSVFFAPHVYDPRKSCTEFAASMNEPDLARWAAMDRAQRTALAVADDALRSVGQRLPVTDRVSVFVGSNLVLEQERKAGARDLFEGIKAGIFSEEACTSLSKREFQTALKRFEHWVDRQYPENGSWYPEDFLPSTIGRHLAQTYGFRGESAAVHSACASSLASLDMACTSLRNGDSDFSVAGGVEFGASCYDLVLCSRMHLLSPSKIRPFDEHADGFSLGDGCSMVVLRRLEDAVRNDEPILALICGIGRSSDSISMVAPDSEGQALAIRRAFDAVPFDPSSVEYLEMHGTGTSRGDVVETVSVSATYGACHRRRPLYMGSIKAAVGHTLAAAGGAGLMRAIFALREQMFPKTLNLSILNPKLSLGGLKAVFPGENIPWQRFEPGPRRAAVNSFGTGGINYHVILEEYKGGSHGF